MNERWTAEDLAEYRSRDRRKRTQPATVAEKRGAAPTHKVEGRRDYKAELLQQLGLVGIATEPEFRFAPPRKWRSDWRVVDTKVLIEFEGGLFQKGKGGHSSIAGILRDCEKYNSAALLGFTVIRVTPKHVVSGEALKWIEQAVGTSLD